MTMIARYHLPMYELRHLRALDAIAAEGSFGRAADRLGYTQSTLSQQVAALERAVGGAVFDRPGGPRPAQLTPLGRVVLAGARDVLDRSRSLGESVDRFRAGGGRVDVGTFQTVTNVLLPAVVRQLRAEQPGCEIRLFEGEEDLADPGDLDVLFHDAPGAHGVDSTLLLEDEHVLLTRRGALPAGPVRLGDLDGVAMVALPPICDQGRVEARLAELGVRPDIVFRTADNQAVVSMVRAGLGYAVMPLLAVGGVPDDELDVHPLRPALPKRQVFALTRGTRSPIAERLVALAAEHAATLDRTGASRA